MAINSSRAGQLRIRLEAARVATTLSGKALAIEALEDAIGEIERLSMQITEARQLWSETYQRGSSGFTPH